jgi:hypothetical protein
MRNTTLTINQRQTQVLRKGTVPRSSKRNDARWNKTSLESRGQAETSIKMEAVRFNTTTGNFHKCFISCAAECPYNIYKAVTNIIS